MEIKSIEKQDDIVTVKMTMPDSCIYCPYFTDDSDGNSYCRLRFVLLDTSVLNCEIEEYNKIAKFCPLRCNNEKD